MDESSSVETTSNAESTNKFELTQITDITYKRDTLPNNIDKTESSSI